MCSIGHQFVFVAVYIVDADTFHVIDCRAQSDGIRDIARAGLETRWRLVVIRFLEGDVLYHVAASLPWGRIVEQVSFPEQRANSGGSEHLVAGENKPVAIELLHIHAHVGDRLGAVDQHTGADAMSHFDHLPGRSDRAQRIGYLREGHEPGPGAQQFLIFIQQYLPVAVHRSHAQFRARFTAQPLPGHDVGVVFQPGNDDLVAFSHILPPPALGDEVDCLGRSPEKDDLIGGWRVEKMAHLFPRILIGIGCAGRKLMRRAMDIGVFVLIEVCKAIDDGLRLLRGGGIVQPDQRTPVDQFAQDREIPPDGIGVKGGMRPCGSRYRRCPRSTAER